MNEGRNYQITDDPNCGSAEPHDLISIIIPTFNEFNYIEACLNSILKGIASLPAEIIVIDGMSTDGTRDIISRYQKEHSSSISLVDNRDTHQVCALNIGVELAKGKYIIRCDAHSVYPATYFSGIIEFYLNDKAGIYGNVGFRYITQVTISSKWQHGIALAMSSRFGVGLSHRQVRALERPRSVDTLLFGAWRREIFEKIGAFDTSFIRGQDYEHNLRIRRAGLAIALIPGAPFKYFTRSSFKNMRRMIYQYAYVKGQLVRKFRSAPNFRSLVPVIFHFSIIASAIISPMAAALIVALYLFAIAVAALLRVPKDGFASAAGMFLAIPQMHALHALGFLHGVLSNPSIQAFIKKSGHTR